MTESDPGSLYQLDFEHVAEAAAFLAALSRFISSPRGSQYRDEARVWQSTTIAEPGPSFFLSQAAFRAATAAFSPLPASSLHGADSLPTNAVLILEGPAAEALGRDEAERRLTTG